LNEPDNSGGAGLSRAEELSLADSTKQASRPMTGRRLFRADRLPPFLIGMLRKLPRFHNSHHAARIAYRVFNRHYPEAAKELNAKMISRAVDFGYLSWPRRIRESVKGKDVLDIGCGTGLHSIGYVVVGVKSYTGVDPRIKLDLDRAKNLRTRQWEVFGYTPRDVVEQFKRVELISENFENIDKGRKFDVVVLHNVTEHLINIDNVLTSAATMLRKSGKIIFNHHNFYAWNGHHHHPKTIDQIDPTDPEQENYLDWAHIRWTPPEDHYFWRGLNKIKLDQLKTLVESHFEIKVWDEIPSNARNGGKRLTNEIVARFPELTRRDLAIHNAFCIAQRKEGISSTRRDILLDAEFMRFYEACKPYTMTTIERMYALYLAIEHIVKNGIEGDLVECGTWRGGSMMMAALALRHFGDDGKRRLYLYDTFAGMPKPTQEDYKFEGQSAKAKWDKTASSGGSAWNRASIEETLSNLSSTDFDMNRIVLVKGLVEETIPKTMPDRLSLLRLDTDFYSSTKHELNHLYPSLESGGVLLLDDYGTWAGARKAIEDYFSSSSAVKRPFLSRIDSAGRLAVKV
jgi:SAM-dependent methyltransferase